MANQFQSISSGMAALKNYYQGPIVDQFNEEMPILRAAEKITDQWSGLQVIRPLRVTRNNGIGATSDGGTLPAIGVQGMTQATISSCFNYLRFGITAGMIAASRNDQGSFVRQAAYELKMGYIDLKNDMNRQLSWDGTGTLARVNTAAVASTTLVIKGREDVEPALKFVSNGLVFDIISSGSVIAAGVTVSAVSGTSTSSTATLTLSQAVTAAANTTLVRSGSYNKEVQGLLYSMNNDTTAIYGVSRTTYPQYTANVVDLNSAAQLKLDTLQQAWNAGQQQGGADYNAVWSDYDSQRMYQKLLTPDKRYSNTLQGDGGFASKKKSYLDWNGLPWVPDKDCPQRIFFLTSSSWKNYVLEDMRFADETGSMYIAQISADVFEVRIRYFNNLFNEQPSAQAVIQEYLSP